MKIIRAYRLGDDGHSIYQLPSYSEQKRQMNETFGEVYSLVERCVIKGSIPKPIERIKVQQEPR